VQIGRKTTVHAQNLLIDDCCNRQGVEAVRERLPQLDVVAALALIVETVNSVDGSTFVVAAQDEKVLRVFDLVSQKQANYFQTLLSAIDVIAQEQVVALRREPTILEQTEKVIVLTVNIAYENEKQGWYGSARNGKTNCS
jgi:hypothetical protein